MALLLTGPHLIRHYVVAPTECPTQHPKQHLNQFRRFALLTADRADSPYALQWDGPRPLKIAPFHGGSEPSSNTWFPAAPSAHPSPQAKWHLIGSAVFAGLTNVTDWPTDRDRQTTLIERSVTIGRI